MKFILFIVLAIIPVAAFAQQADSARVTLDKVPAPSPLDSIVQLTQAPDTLSPDLSRYTHQLDSVQRCLSHRIDSLKKMNLPTGHYSQLLDSIQRSGPIKDIRQAEARLSALEQKTSRSVNSLVNGMVNGIADTDKKFNTDIQLLNKTTGSSIGTLNTPSLSGGLPAANHSIPITSGSNSLPGSNELNVLKLSNTGVSTPGLSQALDVTNNKDLALAKKGLSDANGYSKDIKALSHGDLDSAKHLTGELQNKATQFLKTNELQTNAAALDQYKSMAAKGNDPAALQGMGADQLKQGVNHFAGKEHELQAAMKKMSKLKQKYPSIKSIHDLPKRAPNPMHGKPLIERLVPGITLQFQSRQYFMIDINPSLGYMFNGRLTAGLGWNARIEFRRSHHYGFRVDDGHVYGPRAYATFSMSKGFAFMGQVESMNSFVPKLTVTGLHDPGTKQWIPGFYVGMRKDYKFFKSIKGNCQTLYNLAAVNYRESPYVDRIQVRLGFEFPMKKKSASSEKKRVFAGAFSIVDGYIPNTPGSAAVRESFNGLKMMRRKFDNDTLRISRGFKNIKKSRRIMVSGKSTYQFSYNRKAAVDEIRNSSGELMATVKNGYDVILQNGRTFTFVLLSPSEWKYQSGEKDIMKTTMVAKTLTFTWLEEPTGDEKAFLELMCRVYRAHK